MKILVIALMVLFSMSSLAKDITVAVGLSLPPYVIKSQDKGIEIDIIRKVMKDAGHNVSFVFVPFSKIQDAVTSGKADAGLTLWQNDSTGLNYSIPYITYQNVAIGLKSKNLSVSGISDLGKYSMAAFQNALLYLGEDFKKVASGNNGYSEFPKQINQVRKFFMEEKELFIGDINIFKYYRAKPGRAYREVAKKDVNIFEIFKPTPYVVGFKDGSLRDQFNEGLKKLRSSGEYDKIINSYIN